MIIEDVDRQFDFLLVFLYTFAAMKISNIDLYMDIVAIERVSFDSFRKKLEQIISLADSGSLSSFDMCIEKEWIEGKTLAASLNISLRTLQTLRERGKLSFSTVGKKVYYKIAEVQKLLDSGRIKITAKE